MIEIYNEDCIKTMDRLAENNVKIDIVLTSPPYNNSTTYRSLKTVDHHHKYDIYLDDRTNEEYLKWSKDLFDHYDALLKPNGIVLYNMSYSNENPDIMWRTVAYVIEHTNFMCADAIVWKKQAAMPNSPSSNKLTRICEFVFVFCRKDEYDTFTANKRIVSRSVGNVPFYESIPNWVEARNNDEAQDLNKATYSSELCEKLLNIYAKPNATVYDSFMGTGTTAVACKRMHLNCYGSELSPNQYEYAMKRIQLTQAGLFDII